MVPSAVSSISAHISVNAPEAVSLHQKETVGLSVTAPFEGFLAPVLKFRISAKDGFFFKKKSHRLENKSLYSDFCVKYIGLVLKLACFYSYFFILEGLSLIIYTLFIILLSEAATESYNRCLVEEEMLHFDPSLIKCDARIPLRLLIADSSVLVL